MTRVLPFHYASKLPFGERILTEGQEHPSEKHSQTNELWEKPTKAPTEFIINCRYQAFHQLGHGSFGSVCYAVDKNNKKEYAVKVENKEVFPSQISKEYDIYQILQKAKGIPRFKYFGSDEDYIYTWSCSFLATL